jgi:hypothetical protein
MLNTESHKRQSVKRAVVRQATWRRQETYLPCTGIVRIAFSMQSTRCRGMSCSLRWASFENARRMGMGRLSGESDSPTAGTRRTSKMHGGFCKVYAGCAGCHAKARLTCAQGCLFRSIADSCVMLGQWSPRSPGRLLCPRLHAKSVVRP